MPFRPPLTYEQLIEIQARRLGDRDVMALLHEIKRLQRNMLRLHQLRDELPRPIGVMSWVYDQLRADLAREPCVIAREALVSELLNPPRVRRRRD